MEGERGETIYLMACENEKESKRDQSPTIPFEAHRYSDLRLPTRPYLLGFPSSPSNTTPRNKPFTHGPLVRVGEHILVPTYSNIFLVFTKDI
jgi:hypothetical protein